MKFKLYVLSVMVGALFVLGTKICVSQAANKPRSDTGNVQQNSVKPHHVVVNLNPLWEKGDEVISGDPDKPGELFVLRIHEYPGTIVPPHRHPMDEHVTIVQGRWDLGTGEKFDPTKLRPLHVGTYSLMPKQMTHFAYSKDGAIIQVYGIGPFRTDWVDPLIKMSETKDKSKFKFAIGDKIHHKRSDGVVEEGFASGSVIEYWIKKPDGTRFMAQDADLVRR